MLRNLFTLALAIIFVILISLFAYKNIRKNEITKLPIENSQNENIAIQKITNNSLQKEQIESIIKEFIINNPNIIIDSLEKMQKNNAQESSKKTNNYVKNNRNEIEMAGNPPFFGNETGDISVVMFYDYNCGYCKKANTVMNNIIKSDPGIKFILRPIAVLGESSMYAAKAFLSTYKLVPNDFPSIHNDMMAMRNISSKSIEILAKKYDIDYSDLENEMNSHSLKETINKNHSITKSVGISGAPSYVINGIFVRGFIPEDKFKRIILQIRSESK